MPDQPSQKGKVSNGPYVVFIILASQITHRASGAVKRVIAARQSLGRRGLSLERSNRN